MNDTYLYIRFSDDKQASGSSYDRQLRYARQYCPTLLEDSDHIYFDSGKSAYSGANLAEGGELKRFYDAVASGTVPKGSTLLVEDLDRLSRDGMWKASDKLRELTDSGIVVVTLRDQKKYSGTLTLSDALTSLIKQELAHEESAKKSRRVADSYLNRYKQARTGVKVKVLLPSWIRWISATEYALKGDETATVQRIFRMAAAGETYGTIVRALNEDGVPPFRGAEKGKLWITASVFGIIKNKAAIGIYTPRDGGEPIESYFPAAVTKEVFDAAQGARAERKAEKITRESAAVNLWSKVAHCGTCGRLMHFLPKGRDNQRYLVCSGKASFACTSLNLNAERAELAFKELLVNVVNADYFNGGNGKDAVHQIRQLAGQLVERQNHKAKLVALLDDDPLPELVASIKRANQAIGELEKQKADFERSVSQAAQTAASKAALMEKVDLVSREGRKEANALLRRLKIKVVAKRSVAKVSYQVFQANRRLLELYATDTEVIAVPYSQEVAKRMHDQGETDELAYSVSLDDAISKPTVSVDAVLASAGSPSTR